jgi:hypothetical protein
MAEFDCDTAGPVKRSEVDAKPAGIWAGTLYDCSTGTWTAAHALVSEDGRFRIFSTEQQIGAALLTGVIETDGDTFTTNSGLFFYSDFACSSCWATSMFATGFVRDRDRIEGRWGTEWGGYGFFTFDFRAIEYESANALNLLPGTWVIWLSGNNEPDLSWTFDANGEINGVDMSGCVYTGQWDAVDSSLNLFDLGISVSGCSLDGYYAGMATWSSGPFNDIVYVSIDDAQQTALQLVFLSQ